MKQTFLLLCVALLACCIRENPVRLTSQVEDGMVTLVKYAPLTSGFSPQDPMTEAGKSGENGFAIPDDGQIYILAVTFENRADQLRYIVLMPGEQVSLEGRLNIASGDPDVRYNGTELYKALYRELDQVKPQTKRFSALARKAEAGETLAPEEQIEFDSLRVWSTEYIVQNIRNHPESPTTAYYLLTRMVPDSCYTELYYSIPEQVRNGDYKQLYDLIRPGESADKTHE